MRAQSVGGGVARDVAIYRDDTPATITDLQSTIRNMDVLVVTHGFNVDRAAGRQALSAWEPLVSLPTGMVYLALLWPGDSAYVPAVDYPIEGNEAIKSGELLATFIQDNLLSAASFSFASHSLGARVVLQTVRGIAASAHVRTLFLMAGAIDDTCLNAEYGDAAQAADRISVLASYHDEVLALAFPVGNFFAGLLTRECPYWHAALGREGPQTALGGKVQQGWQIPNPWRYGHHNYLPSVPTQQPFQLPQNVPPLATLPPNVASGSGPWEPAWSAAILSTRLSAGA